VGKAREQREADRLAYDAYRHHAISIAFRALPAKERTAIEQLADKAASRFKGSLREATRAAHRERLTVSRYPDRIKSFEKWRQAA